MIDLNSLNDAARHQLTPSDFSRYEEYRDELIAENNPDIDEILTGHIWGCIDQYEMFAQED